MKHILYLLFALPFMLTSCVSDDIDEIFVSGTWNVGNFYVGGDWHKINDGARPAYTNNEDIKALNLMTVSFLKDGTLEGKMLNGTFSARWEADADGRTISVINIKTSSTPTGKSKELIEALKKAAYYKGDSNVLKLASEDKKSYVQLGHYPENK